MSILKLRGENMLNNVVLIGRLAQDPELRYTPSDGVAVTNFNLAVDRPFSNQQGERDADFIRIVAWRKQAENVANYLKKGSLCAVEGRLQIRSYDDREGIRRIAAEVVANRVQFLDRRGSGSGTSDDPFAGGDDDVEVKDEDVPF